MAISVVKSGFFGAVKTEAQAMTLMLIAQADGIHPIRAAMEYDIIGGKPAPKATTVLARFQESGGTVQWLHSDDKKAVAKFSHPKGGEITITWTIERAQKAELLKNDTWKKFPDQMLRARCIPEGVRAIFPACLSGMYTADEVSDMQYQEVVPLAVADESFIEVEEVRDELDLKIEKSEECEIEYTPEKNEGRLRRRFQIGILSSFIGCIFFATSIISLLTREFNFYSIFLLLCQFSLCFL
jgi:hypothetical protein